MVIAHVGPGASELRVDVDPVTGEVKVSATAADGTSSLPVDVQIIRTSATGEDVFETTLQGPSGSSTTFEATDWGGDGALITAKVDTNGDGTVDETTTVIDSGPAGEMPAAVSNLAGVATADPKVVLTWTDHANSETGFEIERGVDGGAFSEFAAAPVNATRYEDATVDVEHTYAYRIRATNPNGTSDWVSVVVALPPVAPSALTATNLGPTSVTLTWTDHALHETGYRIERAIDGASLSYVTLATLPADTTSYEDATLSDGTSYWYRVTVLDAGGDVSALLQVQTPALPPQPITLAATVLGPTAVTVTWSVSAGADTVELERAEGARSFVAVGEFSAAMGSIIDTAVQPEKTYYYRIRSQNAVGDSDWLGTDPVTTPALPPGDVHFTDLSSSSVTFVWTDRASTESGYRIERSEDSGITFQTRTSLPADSATYTDTLAADHIYLYRIVVIAPGGETSATLDVVSPGRPPAPSNFVGHASGDTITLTWKNNAMANVSFVLDRQDGSGTFVTIAQPAVGTTSYDDTGLAPETAFIYRLRATNADGDSDWTDGLTVTSVPPPPTELAAVPLDVFRARLTWTDNAHAETTYRLDRSADGTSFVPIADLGANATEFTDNANQPGAQLVYRVAAVGPDGESDATVTVTMPNLPATPDQLTATAIGSTKVTLSWKDEATDETSYEIQRDDGSGTPILLTSLPANAVSYTDTAVVLEHVYTYAVRAVNDNGPSPWSLSATAATPPLAPTNVAVQALSPTSALVTWTDPGTSAHDFTVERAVWATTNYVLVGSGTGDNSFTDTVPNGSAFIYRVTLFANGVGASATAGAEIPPLAPQSLTGAVTGTTTIHLAWVDQTNGEVGFQIQRVVTGNAFGSSILKTVASNVTSYDDTTGAIGTSYDYRVRASHQNGPSDWSNTVTVALKAPAPAQLKATSPSTTQVTLTWQDKATTETGYRVERADGATSSFTELAVLPANSVSYTDSTVTAGQSYTYRVSTIAAGLDSPATVFVEALLCELSTGTASCDSDTSNGCEIDITSDVNHCGNCTTVCSLAHGTAQCVASSCQPLSCDEDYVLQGDHCVALPVLNVIAGTGEPGDATNVPAQAEDATQLALGRMTAVGVGPDGKAYVQATIGEYNGYVFAVTPDGYFLRYLDPQVMPIMHAGDSIGVLPGGDLVLTADSQVKRLELRTLTLSNYAPTTGFAPPGYWFATSLDFDSDGALYVTAPGGPMVWKINPALDPFQYSPHWGVDQSNNCLSFNPGANFYCDHIQDDNGPPGPFTFPTGIAVASPDLFYVADSSQQVIWAIGPDSSSVFAGGALGRVDGPRLNAGFFQPRSIVLDHEGNMFVADWGNSAVRKIGTDGMVTTVATAADGLSGPEGLAIDATGRLLIADSLANRLFRTRKAVAVP